jgi:phage-related protein
MVWRVDTYSKTVDDEIEALPLDLSSRLARLVQTIETYGLDALTVKQRKHLEGKLWELRIKGRDGIARAIYVSVTGPRVVILHVFQKKTQKTPLRALHLAQQRAKNLP